MQMRAGISTCYPSAFALGPPNPGTIVVARETLGIRWTGFSPVIFVTHPNILSSHRFTKPHSLASTQYERSPTIPEDRRQTTEDRNNLSSVLRTLSSGIHSFGDLLSPVEFSARQTLTSELLHYL